MPDIFSIKMPTIVRTETGCRVAARLEAPPFLQELWYEVTGCEPVVDGTPFAIAALPLAMAKGWDLHCQAPVSGRLLQSFHAIQTILQSWIPGTQRIHCSAPEHVFSQRHSAAGCFFSGGVDSYYTFLKHQQSITNHVFITGFDVPLSKPQLAQRISAEMKKIALGFQVNLIEVKTNLREFCDRFVSWRMYHGAALASVAHLLGNRLGTMYLAATHTYADLFPCGTHPMLDPLWSSEAVEIIHDGCEATRFEKVAFLAQNPLALKSLRVCYRNKNNELNCGQCEKCLRTMISLYSLNVLDQCESFDKQLDPKLIARMRLGDNPRILMYVQENLEALKERRDSQHVISAVERSMRRPSMLRKLNKQAKPLFRKSTYLKLFGSETSQSS
ncbi:MAG: hypothetical protein JNJ77_20525 [Planctomycetia bacterium]|nr:hypothetical protein [Planctomycetia bacterium]